jgi:hypothetical protein
MGAAEKLEELRVLVRRAQEIVNDLSEPESDRPNVEVLFMDAAAFAARRSVSASTVKRWIRQGLPHARLGRIVRVKVADAERWLDNHGI